MKCAGFSASPLARSTSSSVVQRLAWLQMWSRSQSNTGARSPRADARVEVGHGAAHRGEPLRGVHRAQRIAGKVAEHAVRPVHVLQRAVLVVAARVHAEQLHHLRVPQRRHVLGLDLAFDQRALDLVAQDDVRRVGHLVGIDADEARLHARRSGGAGCAARRPAARRRPATSSGASRATKPGWLPSCISKLRLWLSCSAIERACATGWPSHVARQVLLVAAVTGLVHRAHQAAAGSRRRGSAWSCARPRARRRRTGAC